MASFYANIKIASCTVQQRIKYTTIRMQMQLLAGVIFGYAGYIALCNALRI